jgi:hypothetical protein
MVCFNGQKMVKFFFFLTFSPAVKPAATAENLRLIRESYEIGANERDTPDHPMG